MEIKVRRKGNIIILDLCGRIDVNSASLIETVGQCLRDGYSDILCNFEMVEFIDYMGISVIVIAYKEAVNNNARIKFTSILAHLKELFSVVGLDKVIDIYATEDLAIEGFKEDKAIENIQKMQLRRRFKRLPIDIKIELKNKNAKIPCCVNADILDLSAVGAYIYGCNQFKLGDDLVLKFKLLPKPEELELDAKVVWLSDKQIQPHLHPGMGVAFSNISMLTQSRVLEFIERNLSLMPSDD
ncbi:MAG: anti-sigma factor antagonist [Candidatus Omnitrophica bacterium]|nr:anti-sigma factor antagonist [Candidatus Omnitrophota bacterium]